MCLYFSFFFFFNATATTEIYTLSLHDALPISSATTATTSAATAATIRASETTATVTAPAPAIIPAVLVTPGRSEEHTSELQSRPHLVCRLLLEKKKENNNCVNLK